MSRTLIQNGTVVTATDTLPRRRAASRTRRSPPIGTALAAAGGPRRSTRPGKYVLPGRHRRAHAPRHAVRRHDVGGRLRDRHDRRGARRHDVRSSTSRSSTRASRCAQALRRLDEEGRGQGRDRLRLPHDHDGAHRAASRRRWTRWSREGVTSFKLFMAYPGVFMLDDALDLPRDAADAARTAARSACTPRTAASSTCSSSARSREGQTAPKYHALTRPAARRGRGDGPRDRARRDGGRPDLHRPPLRRRGARAGDGGARPRPARVRRDLPAVPLPLLRELRGARLRGREVRHDPAAARRRATRRRSGAASPATTCRRSRPTTARSA